MFLNKTLISVVSWWSQSRVKKIFLPSLSTERDQTKISSLAFDSFSRSVGSQIDRRDIIKVSFFGMISMLLGSLGLKEAFAAANCLCGRELYDSALQCCTPTGVKTKYPIADLDSCPNRVQVTGVIGQNGCGAQGGQAFPNSFFGTVSFLGCCNSHDQCWGKCSRDANYRNNCDFALRDCIYAGCDNGYPVTGIFDTNRIKRGTCRSTADAYFRAVQSQRFGTPAFVSAQRAACQCCDTQPCVTCPGGTCGSLPSCQDPGCVCFRTIEGNGFCHLGQPCAGLSTCSSSAQCPSGWACVNVSCCGATALCLRPCFVVGAPVASLQSSKAVSRGPMTDGSK